ncbi:hypothetical protein [Pseudodesulfovibrio tunisiensis]|uniref:hypothetical protein n=1 Tax=Pseudodesulfovibrio tunisiensis TaxID=463192 RepID=UPI001FB52AD7|nr:hypothetical protein [Pseudodesulfovibrio tunisiensis]
MLDKAAAIPAILSRLSKLAPGQGLDLRTYKRDRSIVIRRTGDDAFHVAVDGFAKEETDTDAKGLKKLLKRLMKQEFPRSSKVRVYTLED